MGETTEKVTASNRKSGQAADEWVHLRDLDDLLGGVREFAGGFTQFLGGLRDFLCGLVATCVARANFSVAPTNFCVAPANFCVASLNFPVASPLPPAGWRVFSVISPLRSVAPAVFRLA